MIEDGTEIEGRYRVVRRLGQGGMGTVYEAELAGEGRRVALKLLQADAARMPDAHRRFSREARAAAAIGHPNIVTVLDTGAFRGRPFLVMELLRGETLGERLSGAEMMRCETACRVAGYVLSALASAHARGIVHRDLKPENVFLLLGGAAPAVKLLDFGVAKFHGLDDPFTTPTLEGAQLGTPAYMAPEQWMGRRDVDHRADVFAVGVMLYEMLTGALPFEGKGRGQLFLQIVEGTSPPEAPSAADEAVPAALDPVVLRALERDRDARYGSAREFLEALRPFGAGGIAVADDPPARVDDDGPGPAGWLERRPARRRGARRWRVAAAALAALALVMVALAAGYSRLAR